MHRLMNINIVNCVLDKYGLYKDEITPKIESINNQINSKEIIVI